MRDFSFLPSAMDCSFTLENVHKHRRTYSFARKNSAELQAFLQLRYQLPVDNCDCFANDKGNSSPCALPDVSYVFYGICGEYE